MLRARRRCPPLLRWPYLFCLALLVQQIVALLAVLRVASLGVHGLPPSLVVIDPPSLLAACAPPSPPLRVQHLWKSANASSYYTLTSLRAVAFAGAWSSAGPPLLSGIAEMPSVRH